MSVSEVLKRIGGAEKRLQVGDVNGAISGYIIPALHEIARILEDLEAQAERK